MEAYLVQEKATKLKQFYYDNDPEGNQSTSLTLNLLKITKDEEDVFGDQSNSQRILTTAESYNHQ